MTTAAANEPNAEQIAYWNEVSGPKWVALDALLDEQIAAFGRAAMDRLGVAPGDSVLDVGCGCGSTSVELALRVGPSGRVVGLDISRVMLERARERVREAGRRNVEFVNADAQTHAFEGNSTNLLFSRFGVMFFEDPARAFRNLRTALAPGGRLGFVCWQSLQKNPWMLVPLAAAAPHIALPPRPAEGAPGPFAFADTERVRGILAAAGFEAICFEPEEREIPVGGGGNLEATVDFVLQMGPAGQAFREAGPELRERVRAAVSEALEPFVGNDGVRMEAAAMLVTASSPSPE
jgi:SAM-dependent methyltransferase